MKKVDKSLVNVYQASMFMSLSFFQVMPRFSFSFTWTLLLTISYVSAVIRSGTFAKYDYGRLGNLLHYYRFSPPSYDLAQIPATMSLWMSWGGNDALADAVDVAHTISELQCKPELIYVENYGHIDFVLSTRAKTDIYDSMIAFFRDQGEDTHAQI